MADSPQRPIALTGIKPTGQPHIGNLVGAIRPSLGLRKQYRTMLFIADYHALTSVQDRATLREFTREVAATWMAFGLDPEETLFYRHSDVPQIFELTWLLSCVTPKGFMNRAHAYKAAVDQARDSGLDDDALVSMGLYNYPILMAADILMFSAEKVPVGHDQVQHVEMARDMAQKFNATFGDTLTLPEAIISDDAGVAKVTGLDGRKMSKSYNNTIPLFCTSSELKKLVKSIVTDSRRPEDAKEPNEIPLFGLYSLFAQPSDVTEIANRLRAGGADGVGWGELKERLYEALEATLTGPREMYNELMAKPKQIDEVLAEGGSKARSSANRLMRKVRKRVGASDFEIPF